MAEIDDSVLNEISDFSKKLKTEFKDIDSIFLFGSFADGSQDEWSDIDLAVITADSVSETQGFEIYTKGKELDSRIDALSFSLSDYRDEILPIIREIRKKGIRTA